MPTLNWIGKDKVLNHHWKYLLALVQILGLGCYMSVGRPSP